MARVRLRLLRGGGVGRELLGGKGAGLAEMTALGVPVPIGFAVTTEACVEFMRSAALPDGLEDEIADALARLERRDGQAARRPGRPAPRLRPLGRGRLDARDDGHDPQPRPERDDRRGARACDRQPALRPGRLPPAAPDVRRGRRRGSTRTASSTSSPASRRSVAPRRTSISPRTTSRSCAALSSIYREHADAQFPQDAREQLLAAVGAVFGSWDTPSAQVYRRANGIPDDLGTAANVVQMVFGNQGDTSATGVAFTREPVDGRARASSASSSSTRRARTSSRASARPSRSSGWRRRSRRRTGSSSRRSSASSATTARCRTSSSRSRRARCTSCRRARESEPPRRRCASPSTWSAERLISREEAVARIDPGQLDQLLHPMIDPGAESRCSPRASTPHPARPPARSSSTPTRRRSAARAGEDVILVRWETTPDDIHGLIGRAAS